MGIDSGPHPPVTGGPLTLSPTVPMTYNYGGATSSVLLLTSGRRPLGLHTRAPGASIAIRGFLLAPRRLPIGDSLRRGRTLCPRSGGAHRLGRWMLGALGGEPFTLTVWIRAVPCYLVGGCRRLRAGIEPFCHPGPPVHSQV